MGYNFGCMIASDTQFDSKGGFSGLSYIKGLNTFSFRSAWNALGLHP